MNISKIKPIEKMSSNMINMSGPLNLELINDSINLYMFVHMTLKTVPMKENNYKIDEKYKSNEEVWWDMKISMKMEMIIRNILINDKNVKSMKGIVLQNYLGSKVYLLTGYFPSTEYIKSVINMYSFLNTYNK